MAGAMLALLGDKVRSGQKYHPISELALAQNQNVAQRTCNVIAWQVHDGVIVFQDVESAKQNNH